MTQASAVEIVVDIREAAVRILDVSQDRQAPFPHEGAFMSLIKQLLASKKAIAMIAGVIVAAVGRIGLELPTDAVTQIVAPIVAYILGQGLADAGKEAMKLDAESFEPRT